MKQEQMGFEGLCKRMETLLVDYRTYLASQLPKGHKEYMIVLFVNEQPVGRTWRVGTIEDAFDGVDFAIGFTQYRMGVKTDNDRPSTKEVEPERDYFEWVNYTIDTPDKYEILVISDKHPKYQRMLAANIARF